MITSQSPMTLDRFRKNDGLRSWLKAVTSTSEWSLLMDAIERSHPRHARSDPRVNNDQNVGLMLGRIQGYDEAITNIETAAEEFVELPEPEVVFAPEKEEKR